MNDLSQLNEKIAHAKTRLCSTVGKRWLAQNFELIEAVAHTGNGLVDLWEASPVRLDSDEPKTDQIIDLLFPGNPLSAVPGLVTVSIRGRARTGTGCKT